jgi:histidinol-phosphate aminotransferase
MDDRAHIARTLEVNAQGMAYLEREFARLELPFVPSYANFFLVDVGDGRAVYDKLLSKGVIVRAMNGYGYPRHVRISVGLPEENRRLVAMLAEVMGAQS